MPSVPTHIFGIHDAGAESLFVNANKRAWIVVSVQVNPPDSDGNFSAFANAGHAVIVRLNNGYNSAGTIPNSAQYDAFAQQCAAFVAQSQGAHIWLIGNETNLALERPGNNNGQGGEVITPDKYAQCFAKVRAAIKKIAAHKDDWVVPSAPAPWNNQTAYLGNLTGDWVKYYQDILSKCIQLGQPPDALALHAYTHGFDPALIMSEEKMGIPFGSRRYQFRAYRDFLGVVPASLKSAPVLITETQAADPDWWRNQNIGWVQAAFKEINDWNAVQTNQPIQALCLFRWLTGEPKWSISDKSALQDDFRAALQNDYRVRLPAPLADPVATAVATEAKKYTWMPINTDAALYKFAQANNLGYPQTDEFTFTFDNAEYLGQVFNLGIVFVKKGDWGNVQWVKKA
ncbi:MAG: hypothetical protein HY868_05915 [Chloroflexi bacterium]|nr:hypothetical protein [Chloroflexota bacterium]